MSPELSNPEEFDLKGYHPTASSDCYALGMVIYEVLSGKNLFSGHECRTFLAIIYDGVRPVRPQGAEGRWFTDDIWKILERCWEHNQNDRPRVEVVLDFLEEVSRSWKSP